MSETAKIKSTDNYNRAEETAEDYFAENTEVDFSFDADSTNISQIENEFDEIFHGISSSDANEIKSFYREKIITLLREIQLEAIALSHESAYRNDWTH